MPIVRGSAPRLVHASMYNPNRDRGSPYALETTLRKGHGQTTPRALLNDPPGWGRGVGVQTPGRNKTAGRGSVYTLETKLSGGNFSAAFFWLRGGFCHQEMVRFKLHSHRLKPTPGASPIPAPPPIVHFPTITDCDIDDTMEESDGSSRCVSMTFPIPSDCVFAIFGHPKVKMTMLFLGAIGNISAHMCT